MPDFWFYLEYNSNSSYSLENVTSGFPNSLQQEGKQIKRFSKHPFRATLGLIVIIYFIAELLEIINRKFFRDGKPVESTIAITNGDFTLCAEIMVMAILQGGPAPNFLSASVASYLVGAALLPNNNKNAEYKLLSESTIWSNKKLI